MSFVIERRLVQRLLNLAAPVKHLLEQKTNKVSLVHAFSTIQGCSHWGSKSSTAVTYLCRSALRFAKAVGLFRNGEDVNSSTVVLSICISFILTGESILAALKFDYCTEVTVKFALEVSRNSINSEKNHPLFPLFSVQPISLKIILE